MAVSKARFSLAVVSSLTFCLTSFVASWFFGLSDVVYIYLLDSFSSSDELTYNPIIHEVIPLTLNFVLCIIVAAFILRFSFKALDCWEGPTTVSVTELAKERLDDRVLQLAKVEAIRLLKWESDPIASHSAVNWKHQIPDPPDGPNWPLLARDLFLHALNEVEIPDDGWRDRYDAWVGKVYTSSHNANPLILFAVEQKPTADDIESRLLQFPKDGFPINDAHVYVVFEGSSIAQDKYNLNTHSVEVYSKRALAQLSLRLERYARELINKFEHETLGSTTATLDGTYTPLRVSKKNGEEERYLRDLIDEWIYDKTRRHLAITGEYGQGKSTEMLKFCVDWARNFLDNGAESRPIPLLIELRGHNPSEHDPTQFLGAWSSRFGLNPQLLFDLVRGGHTILIFEGFDELRNAGREYDRYEHFKALWAFAFPGNKLIFTGRPNFFIDETEKNRTLRTKLEYAAGGRPHTEVWEIQRLQFEEIKNVAHGFGASLAGEIVDAVENAGSFFDIVSRPSMLPVVASIWGKIREELRSGQSLTNALLIEKYLNATYQRKRAEIEAAEGQPGRREAGTYLVLPDEVRHFFCLLVVWKMAANDARNTVSRQIFNEVISNSYDRVFKAFQSVGVSGETVEKLRTFEEQFKDESLLDRVTRIQTEVASASLFVDDPVGGDQNLRLPHKQFYEYLIATAALVCLTSKDGAKADCMKNLVGARKTYRILLREPNALRYLYDMKRTTLHEIANLDILVGFLGLYYQVVIEDLPASCGKRLGLGWKEQQVNLRDAPVFGEKGSADFGMYRVYWASVGMMLAILVVAFGFVGIAIRIDSLGTAVTAGITALLFLWAGFLIERQRSVQLQEGFPQVSKFLLFWGPLAAKVKVFFRLIAAYVRDRDNVTVVRLRTVIMEGLKSSVPRKGRQYQQQR